MGFSSRKEKERDFNLKEKTGVPGDYYTYGTACTEVEIDVLTGEHQVNFNIRDDTVGFSKKLEI